MRELKFMNEIKIKRGLAGKMAELFLSNKELGVLTIIVLLSWGIFSFLVMPKQYNPKIVAPAFSISTEFPGANSDEVYQLITRPMENKLKELSGVDKIMSESLDGGISIVTTQFYIGENIENAKISLMQKLESNKDISPLGASSFMIQEIDPESVPIVVFSLTSNEYSSQSLRKMAIDIGEKLKMVSGTANIEVKGGRKKQLEVSLDEGRLSAYDISLEQVVGAISANNSRVSAGNIESDELNFRVVIDGNIKDEKDLTKILVKKSGRDTIYLGDLADIEYNTGEIKNYVRYSEQDSSKEAVYLSVSKLAQSNAMSVSKEVIAEMEKLKGENIFEKVDINLVRDDGRIAEEAVMSLTQNLFLAIGIVSLVLLFFLGWRSAIVVAVAIPLTLASVFGVGNLFGQSINRITLFALILSLGLLVDNATVVVENVYRMLRENPERKKTQVIVQAVDEVGAGLFMSTVTTILAFIPMAFVTGMMGPYMGPIPFFVPVALVASLIIAFTINPFLLNFLTPRDGVEKRQEQKEKSFFLVFMDRIKQRYEKILRKIIANKKLRRGILVGVFLLFLISMSLPALKIVKFRMLPKADKEQFYVYLDFPKYFSVEKTNEASRLAEKIIFQNNEVKSIQSYVGESQVVDFNGLFKGSDARVGENQATLKINFSRPDSRKKTSQDLVLSLREKLQDGLSNYPDLRIKLIEDPPGPPVLSTFLIKVQGENQEKLEAIARDIEQKAFEIEKVVDVDSTINERTFEQVLEIDKEKANLSGLNSAQITSVVRTILSGTKVGLYHQSSDDEIQKPEQEYIVLNFKKEDRDQQNDLNKIFITNSFGEKVPLSAVTHFRENTTDSIIRSDDFKKTVYVSAEMGARSVTYSVIDAFKFLLDYKLPSGNGKIENWSLFGINYRDQVSQEKFYVVLDGEWKLTLEVFRDLGIAMAVAIFLIYFVLVAQFKSLKIPLLIMGTIPLAMIGVMPGFALLGVTSGIFFNATSMIGVIALSGIVVNNAIIFLEYLNELKANGELIEEAIIKAGKTRFLPIILTSLTTVLGSLTIISDPVWSGLAWSIVWGLSVATFLTLVIFPLLYYTFERKKWRSELERIEN